MFNTYYLSIVLFWYVGYRHGNTE